MRLRRAWHDVLELASFLGAVTSAVARFLIGRWPEPAGQDYLAPTGEPLRRGVVELAQGRAAPAGPRREGQQRTLPVTAHSPTKDLIPGLHRDA